MNRRSFVKSSVIGSLLGSTELASAAGPTPGLRIAVNGLAANNPTVQKYASAVAKLKALPSSDPRNWTNLASVHNNHCPHNNWWFLPWHRAYLHYFELTCQSVLSDPSFRLPYWNWTQYPRIPGPFLDPQSSLYDSTRQVDGNFDFPSEAIGSSEIQTIVGSNNWVDLYSAATTDDGQRDAVAAGELEGTPHNSVHGIIGGDMGNFMSPLDPIFWMHHCNIDRIWASWQKNLNNTPPPDALWKNHKLVQFYDPVSKMQVSPVVQTTVNPVPWGSVYDHYETLPGAPVVLTQALRNVLSSGIGTGVLANGIRRFSMAAEPRASADSVSQFAAAGSPDFTAVIQKAVQSAGPRPASVSLLIEGVQPPSSSSVALRVFLNCKNPSLSTPLDDPTYAGTVAFFGSHGDMNHGVTFSLDVSRTLAKTIRAGIYTAQTPIDVSLVPVDLRNPRVAPGDGPVKASNVRLVGLTSA